MRWKGFSRSVVIVISASTERRLPDYVVRAGELLTTTLSTIRIFAKGINNNG
ncbi:MAG: hypothetical protein ACHQQQ_11065 [Bacteroidota bacterium]